MGFRARRVWASQRQRWAVGRGPVRPPLAGGLVAGAGAAAGTAVEVVACEGREESEEITWKGLGPERLCACGAVKSAERPFCLDCYLAMPPELQVAIRRGDLARGTEWVKARLARGREWARRQGWGR